MATTKFDVTRKSALDAAIAALKDNGIEFEDDTIKVLENMSAKLIATPKTRGESEAHKQNAKTLDDNLDVIIAAGDAGISAREFAVAVLPKVGDNKPAVQKATRILLQGANDKKLIKVPQTKKSEPIRYKLNEVTE